jgi:hypothetical protein
MSPLSTLPITQVTMLKEVEENLPRIIVHKPSILGDDNWRQAVSIYNCPKITLSFSRGSASIKDAFHDQALPLLSFFYRTYIIETDFVSGPSQLQN